MRRSGDNEKKYFKCSLAIFNQEKFVWEEFKNICE
jgi:hypothetical protein